MRAFLTLLFWSPTRNDELCILYEKSNIQKAIVKKGDEELKQREAEVETLNLVFSTPHAHIHISILYYLKKL